MLSTCKRCADLRCEPMSPGDALSDDRATGVSPRSPHVRVVLGAVVMLLAALLAALLGLWGAATTCGEGCQQPGFGWIDEPDAWQWRVQAVVACLGVLPAGALVVAALSGDRARARASFALTAIVYGVWTIGFFP